MGLFFRSSKESIDRDIASKKEQIARLKEEIDSAKRDIADAKAYNKAQGKKVRNFDGLSYTLKRKQEQMARLKEELAKLREKKKR